MGSMDWWKINKINYILNINGLHIHTRMKTELNSVNSTNYVLHCLTVDLLLQEGFSNPSFFDSPESAKENS